MPGKDIIVIGASAGGIEALRSVFGSLPADFPASIFVVLHTSPDSPGVLAHIFAEAGPLPVKYAVHGERIEPGWIYVARADHHMLVAPGKIELTRGPRENRFRPAIDPLFRSAAQTYGPRVVGVILSGGLDDGVNGLWTIKQLGGTTVVQDPDEALAPSMPLSALTYVRVDYKVRVAELAPLLVRLAATRADAREGELAVPEDIEIEVKIAKEDKATTVGVQKLGTPSMYACPECHGVLLQMKDANPLRFRCHTGHAYTLESLLADMDDVIEDSLWSAIRALEERAMLMRQAAAHAREAHAGDARALLEFAEETQRRADIVRQAVFDEHAKASGAGA
ncbi:MAG: chemotaxis protein CheB [Acidobacteria bacterium]|nr:chemotaxis protein CheB [Acidobacteriota bacterium]MBV9475387.1 chemotaxis protein CheB [Acidobacteriota bacterium]